jgi:hypothetical protein
MFNFGFLMLDAADVGKWEGANVGRGPATLRLGKPC